MFEKKVSQKNSNGSQLESENLYKLEDETLMSELQKSVKEEKRVTQRVLDFLEEVERRKLYAKRGYPSLFEFCVKELKYSESSAQRRISAMRVIRTIPEAKSKLESSAVNLSTLSQLHSFIRREEKLKNVKLNQEMKRGLLEAISDKSQRDCEKAFIAISPQSAGSKESTRPLTSDLTELKFVASKELIKKIARLREILSHRDVHSLAGLFETLADFSLDKLEVDRKRNAKVSALCCMPIEFTSAAEVDFAVKSIESGASRARSRYIPRAIKEAVRLRDVDRCQYFDHVSGRQCEGRHFLQFDHKIPFARGGPSIAENLRLLCFNHNALHAAEELRR